MTIKSYSTPLFKFIILLAIQATFIASFTTISRSQFGHASRNVVVMSSLYASSSDDIRSLVSRAEMILVVPTSTVRTEYISGELTYLLLEALHEICGDLYFLKHQT